jgi:general secretion pathway protein M
MTLPTGIRGQFMAVALLAIMVLLAYQFVALPAFDAYRARDEAIEDTERAIRRYRNLLAQEPALVAFNDRYASQQPLAPLLLPGSNPALSGAALQQQLQDLAAQHGVRVLSLRIRQAELDGRFERIAVEARMQSDMAGLRDLLFDVEQSEPYLFVENLAVRTRPQRRRGANQPSRSTLDTRLVVYGLRSPTLAVAREPGR